MQQPLAELDHQAALARFAPLSGRSLRREVLRVASDRHYRPADLGEQYFFLRALSESERIDLPLRVGLCVAAAHKAMESLDVERCQAIVGSLRGWLDTIDQLAPSSVTRHDRTHQLASTLATLLQVQLFTGDLPAFERTAATGAARLMRIETRDLTRAYFVTAGNVLRCLAFAALPAVRAGDRDGVQAHLYAMEQVCAVATARDAVRHVITTLWLPQFKRWLRSPIAIWRARGRPVESVRPSIIFFEYLQAVGMHHRLCDMRARLDRGEPEAITPAALFEQSCELLRVAIRSENHVKVGRMLTRYREAHCIAAGQLPDSEPVKRNV